MIESTGHVDEMTRRLSRLIWRNDVLVLALQVLLDGIETGGGHPLRTWFGSHRSPRLTHDPVMVERCIVLCSGLMDEHYYLRCNPDLSAHGVDAFAHFMEHGYREGRAPGPFFALAEYLVAYDDVRRAGLNGAYHLVAHGLTEGRGAGLGNDLPVPRRPSKAIRGTRRDVEAVLALLVGGTEAISALQAGLMEVTDAVDREREEFAAKMTRERYVANSRLQRAELQLGRMLGRKSDTRDELEKLSL